MIINYKKLNLQGENDNYQEVSAHRGRSLNRGGASIKGRSAESSVK